eukprot:scaffold174092_cov34-Prasinocladus_malaysianus.AAC.1
MAALATAEVTSASSRSSNGLGMMYSGPKSGVTCSLTCSRGAKPRLVRLSTVCRGLSVLPAPLFWAAAREARSMLESGFLSLGWRASLAMAWVAASFISSLTHDARQSSAPRKMNGKAQTAWHHTCQGLKINVSTPQCDLT